MLLVLLALLLGCTQAQLKNSSKKLDRLTDKGGALDDVFNNKERPAGSARGDGPSGGAKGGSDGDGEAVAAVQDPHSHDLFNVPRGWKVAKEDDEILVYQLKHESRPDASIVISYDPLQKEGELARRNELRELHTRVVGRLPEGFAQQEYREWIDQKRAYIYTRLQGKKAEDAPEMVVSGHSVGVGSNSYTVFAAYRSGDHAKLSRDVEALVKSLKDQQGDEEQVQEDEDVPAAPVKEEPPADTKSSKPGGGAS